MVGESFQSLLTVFLISGAASISAICCALGTAMPVVALESSKTGVSSARAPVLNPNAPKAAQIVRRSIVWVMSSPLYPFLAIAMGVRLGFSLEDFQSFYYRKFVHQSRAFSPHERGKARAGRDIAPARWSGRFPPKSPRSGDRAD